MSSSEIYQSVVNEINNKASLVAVSKRKPQEAILELYHLGQRIFGENQVQELVQKHKDLPKDIQWHFIGHLQTNKVKYIAPFIDLIHAVDSFKLLKTINKEAVKNKRTIKCLLQFHIARENTKFGLTIDKVKELLHSQEYKELMDANSDMGVDIVGVMGMATNTSDAKEVRKEFATLKLFSKELKSEFFANKPSFKELSMGMSQDYSIAIEEGSTMVRIGSLIFGNRL